MPTYLQHVFVISLLVLLLSDCCVSGFSFLFPPTGERPQDVTRREIFQGAVSLGWVSAVSLLVPPPAWAQQQDDTISDTSVAKKPYASLEKLLPAARVQWTIDQSVQLVDSMDEASQPAWNQLEAWLLVPQNFTQGQDLPAVPKAPAQAYLDTYQRNRQGLNVLAQPGAVLVQSGEIAAWKRLKRQERIKEEDGEIRAALNLYTSALSYRSDSYLLNVPASERKQMIRQDRLPDVKQVIQSDMGMRYLYRNELLTTMQEVRAELAYQLDQKEPSKQELAMLLHQAHNACRSWFSLIDDRDAQDALRVVNEEKSSS